MGDQDTTEIVCIIDRSGSMEPIRADAIGGFNSFLADQQREPGRALLSLVLFDHELLAPIEARPIDQVPPLDQNGFVPRGQTALYDAVCVTLSRVRERIAAAPADQRPARVIAVILTDGQENASRYYTREQVFTAISELRGMGWDFVFLAANQDAFATGEALGVARGTTVSFMANSAGLCLVSRESSRIVSLLRKRSKPTSSEPLDDGGQGGGSLH